ncbi:Uncharacterised protein [Mycobacteroides abscessus subsp. massiliense]|nr:Uncharacterised protein [Mycobacteroides abscessus subsp. massiliense]SLF89564.1 Uncharacterised protein [Mycobacteroides abscessus subsp. massiliense]SLK98873.1 Uncharacterised protein [Mycobacteroides abscessus subsp. massiliense]
MPRPRAPGGRARCRENPFGAHTLGRAVPRLQACAVHSRPHAGRCHRLPGLRRTHRGVRIPRWPGIHQSATRRRDQPDPAEDTGSTVGGHGGTSGHRRWHPASPARSVHRCGHPESHRIRGHVSAARSPARSLSDEAQRLSARARSRDRHLGSARPRLRSPKLVTCHPGGLRRRSGGRPRGSRSGAGGTRGACLRGRCDPGDPPVTFTAARRIAACRDGPAGDIACLGLALRPQLCHPRRCQGHGPPDPAPSHRPASRGRVEGATSDRVLDGILVTVPVPR